jgi:hypothetical protein
MSILANNTDWSVLNSEMLQKVIDNPRTVGQQFTLFLKNGGKVVLGSPSTFLIDRGSRFSPTAFFKEQGWQIVEEDKRSLALTEIDLSKVLFEMMLKEGETVITGEEKLKRLKASNHIRLDAKIFLALWENQYLIPESWKEKVNGNVRYIFFDGTILRHPDGIRCVLCLSWYAGRWHWYYRWLDYDWDVISPSAVLAS